MELKNGIEKWLRYAGLMNLFSIKCRVNGSQQQYKHHAIKQGNKIPAYFLYKHHQRG